MDTSPPDLSSDMPLDLPPPGRPDMGPDGRSPYQIVRFGQGIQDGFKAVFRGIGTGLEVIGGLLEILEPIAGIFGIFGG